MMARSKIVGIQAEGVPAILKRLKKLPERNRRHALRPAVKKAGGVVAKAARRLAPKGAGMKPSGQPRKNLKKTIKVTSVKWYRNTDTFAVVIGPEKKEAPHAHLVHNGTKPHAITLGKPLVFMGVVLPEGFQIQHPGAKPNPFLERAVEQTRTQVNEKLQSEILAGIEKQVAKLAKQK